MNKPIHQHQKHVDQIPQSENLVFVPVSDFFFHKHFHTLVMFLADLLLFVDVANPLRVEEDEWKSYRDQKPRLLVREDG